MKTKFYIIFISGLLFLFAGCEKILDKFPLDKPSDETFLSSEAELVLAINGVYNNLWDAGPNYGQFEYMLDNTTDISWRRGTDFPIIANGSHVSTTSTFQNMWDLYYGGIAKCNFILTHMNRAEGNANQQVMDEVEGQALFMRAYWYSQLVMLYGDVPFVTTPLTVAEGDQARVDKNIIVDQLLTDLDRAAELLPVSWPSSELGRVAKGAAFALKSRVALMHGQYETAVDAAKQVLALNVYQLYPDYNALFRYEGESSSEVIFEVMFQNGIKHHGFPLVTHSRNAGGHSIAAPAQTMVDSYECIDGLTIDKSPLYDPANPFENRDPRLRQTIAVPGDVYLGYQYETHKDSLQCWNYRVSPARRVANQDATNPYASFTGYNWKKGADPMDTGSTMQRSSLNAIIIRLAEVYLNLAEAKIELNQIDQECLDAINAVRGRDNVGMPAIAAGKSQREMRTLIRRERKVELAMEGLRLFDIRRWGIAHKVMPGPFYGRPNKPYSYKDQGIPTIDEDGIIDYSGYADKLTVVEQRYFNPDRDYLWAIPQKEMDINDQLEQNKGY